ncbi:MAG TPA: PLP-dependent aspartate aminotransferase family protein [Acidobacteriota bacterium]|nr:PLP-dependent aspartate aminotransferase family protein [Acidobacteriota bacterium]
MGFATDAIHGGDGNDDETGAVTPPIHLSTTFARHSVEEGRDYTYSRHNNPTREHLEKLVARLEGGSEGMAFASGMAAITAIFSTFTNGDHFVVTDNVYSGTFRALRKLQEHNGVKITFSDSSNLVAFKHSLTDETKLVFIETPTNPLLKVSDISSIAEAAHERGSLLCVDNSCLTPYLQQPLSLGADLVIHSTSKYFSGHSDTIGGVVITSNQEIAAALRSIQSVNGAVLSPFDCWLLMRGIKTLALRMNRHSENGQLIAEYLSNHPKVSKVYYPGLPSQPNSELARRQSSGSGGIVSVELEDQALAIRFLNSLKLFRLAESVGGVESMASHPYTMTFGKLSVEEKDHMGILPQLVRLSAGIEDVEDLIEDIDNAFEKAS